MILISVLFLVPIYYLARSKGYNGGIFATATGVLALIIGNIPVPQFGILYIVLPAAVLILVSLLKPKADAPGESYLKIVFPCPECAKTVSFPRHREGVAELCPECGELIRVPEDEHSPKPSARDRTKPPATQGEVCLESFGRPEPADQLAAILNDSGINARVASDSGGGVLPQIGNTEGHRVMIDATQWNEAVEIERQCQQTPAEATSETVPSAASEASHPDR